VRNSAGGRAGPGVLGPVSRTVRRGGAAARKRLVVAVGGPARTRVVVLLACVLALASADTATVGASAVELRRALHISNTDIGLLVTVTSVVAAVFSVPFGMLADRVRRTWILAFVLVTWGAAMLWSAAAGSFGQLLLARLFLGAVTAAAGPTVASLVGDWFPAAERGRIYSYVLTGELLGAGAGFAVTGDIAALSWPAAFVILGLPAFVLAWFFFRLPEPARGGQGALPPEPGLAGNQARPPGTAAGAAGPGRTGTGPEAPDAQQLAAERGIPPDPKLAARANRFMTIGQAIRYVLAVRTNIALIVSSACGYYFLAGVQTFGPEFAGGQYHIGQVAANLLLLVVGAGAVAGVLASGPAGDALLRRGHLNARIVLAGVAAVAAVVLFIPALVTHSAVTALPYIVLAAAALSAQNPPLDAARLDIMPPWLWGRAEGVRTFLRTGAQALAPLLFGVLSDQVGLRWTFVVMLLPLTAAAAALFWARRSYPSDVATAGLLTRQRAPRGGRPPSRRATGPPQTTR
jgi:MFS family permease